MSTFQDSQSTHNRETSDFLHTVSPLHHDWEIITLFYSALHKVDKYFIDNGITKPRNHGERKNLVRQHLSIIYPSYHKLSTFSHRARYTVGTNIPINELPVAQTHYNVIDTNLP
ncbi:MAG: hypothetical protein K5798_03450 [Nitrosopumilus sp.]|uniref:hypothetical protein n=1 Tax=Nitrosopumilus sp. TaxID=2024843 RepID=UPI00242AB9D5|nr:hypothetical protein [Nitrosopumilus sp.]MCV0366307.1 hypothetical protein [Nitrosopumilus sp.]